MVNPISSSSVNSKGTLPETNKDPFNEIIKSQVEKIKSETSQGADVKSYKLLSDQKNGSDYLNAAKIIYSIFPHLDQKKKITLEFPDGKIEISQDVFEALKKDSKTIRDMSDDAQGEIAFSLINKKTFEELLKKLYSSDSTSKEIDIELIKCANYLDCKELLDPMKDEVKKTVNSLRPEELEKAFTLNIALQSLPPPLFEDIIDDELNLYFGKTLQKSQDPKALIEIYAKKKVRSLHLAGNVSQTVLNELKNLSGLKKLAIRSCDNFIDDNLNNLPTSLEYLDLAHTKISDSALAYVGSLISLENMNLSYTGITDGGLAHLKLLSFIKILDLSSTKITDEGLVHLKALSSLQILRLPYTDITDAGLAHLKSLSAIRTLNLISTKISGKGLVHLGGLFSLQNLYLSSTSITDEGLAHLKSLDNIRILDLESTKITDEGLVLIKALSSLQNLDLSSTKITDEGLAHLGALTFLTTLSLNKTKISGNGLLNLNSLSSLKSLHLNGVSNIRKGLSNLLYLTSIENLSLCQTYLADEDLLFFRSMSTLKTMNLSGNFITDEGLINFTSISGLKTLDLTRTQVTERGKKSLPQGIIIIS